MQHAGLRHDIARRVHGTEGTDRLDRPCDRKFPGVSILPGPFLIFVVFDLGGGEKVRIALFEPLIPNTESIFQERCGSCIPLKLNHLKILSDRLCLFHVSTVESMSEPPTTHIWFINAERAGVTRYLR